MDGAPGIENDHTSNPSPTHGGSPETQLAPTGSQQSGPSGHSAAQSPSSSSKNFSSVPHMRSRITVVCAECKRLKLKCDRRTPCGSCLKRDTVQRCIYSQAAAEKIDVQSLHNRLLLVEGTLAQMTQGGPSTAAPFKSSYPPSASPIVLAGPSSISQSASTSNTNRVNASSVLAGLPCNDKSCLVIGSSGSSVIISLEDTASIWLNELECSSSTEDGLVQRASSVSPYSSVAKSASTGGTASRVKLEPTPVLLPPQTSTLKGHPRGVGPARKPGFIPPVPYGAFLPAQAGFSSYGPPGTSSQAFTSTFSSVPDTSSAAASSRQDIPQVTTALLTYLPSAQDARIRYLTSFEEVMPLHHTVNVRHFKRRIEAMLSWSEPGTDSRPAKADLAKELFCGASSTKKTSSSGKERSTPPAPTLSFFAATCTAFALGALISREESGLPPDGEAAPRNTPAGLFALSEQALGYFEKTNSYDLDSLVAMLFQILYLLHDGQMNVSQCVLPLMGKMVNVAKMMGLATDPDEFPGTYSLFDAETRRRIWWDIYYYDMLVAECMGQQPLIHESSFTTKHLSETDDDRFTPSSVTVPVLTGEVTENRTTFFVLRNRLTQIVRTIKKQSARDLVEEPESSMDQASGYETELTTYINEMPQEYRLAQDCDPAQPEIDPSDSKAIVAQRCILAILSNRAILKLYLPYLKEGGGAKPSHQAVLGCINASHSIIYAGRILHSLWRDTRPAVFDFYDFGRTLFDAAVLCAHAVIQQPSSILAQEALRCVTGALDVMRVLSLTKIHGESAEAIKVVELMKDRAERARAAGFPEAAAGAKRKRADEEGRQVTLTAGFQLPFVGPSVCSAKAEPSRAPLQIAKAAVSGPKKDDAKAGKAAAKEKEREREKEHERPREREREKEKSKRPPPWGIRSRPSSGSSQAPPPVRQRTNSMAPSSSASPVTTTNMLMPPTAGVGPPHQQASSTSTASHASSSPDHTSPTSTPVSDPSVSPGYTYPTQPAQSSSPNPVPQVQPPPMQRDYQIGYPDGNDAQMVDARGYSQSYAGSSQPAQYDQRASVPPFSTPTHTGPAYRATQASSDYFVQPYSPAVSSPTYDQSRMAHGHGHALPMQPYGIESGMGGSSNSSLYNNNSIPGTPASQTYMLPPDKAAPPYEQHHIGKPELNRQMSHEYQPTATSHGVAMTASQMATQYVQGWPQTGQDMPRGNWDYKYYGS